MEERGARPGSSVGEEFPSPEEWARWAAPEWDELLQSTLELGAYLLKAQRCAFLLLDRQRQRLAVAVVWEGGSSATSGNWVVPRGELEWQALEGNGPVIAARPARGWLAGSRIPEGQTCNCACSPVQRAGVLIGVIEAVRGCEAEIFRPADLRALELVAHHLSLCLRNSVLHLRMSRLANTDGLTGAFNFRYFQDRLDLEVERARRYGRPVSLIMLDLNHFKSYNDLFGHQQGDVALRITAATIERAVRRVDVVTRYGGDEFAVILPEAAAPQALLVAARVARAVRDQALPAADEEAIHPLSCCMGISCFPILAQGKESLIAQADEALYHAKGSRTRSIRVWEPHWRSRARNGQDVRRRQP